MTEPHPPLPPVAALGPGAAEAAARWIDESDWAIGCECADPSLQIERWRQDDAAGAEAG